MTGFKGKHNEEIGHYGQTLIILMKCCTMLNQSCELQDHTLV